jgi:peptidoglycan hydrolase-like protein with peptidoglycan-binding domain
MPYVTSSVGKNCANKYGDVVTVQELLNKAGANPALVVDGDCGNKTIKAIEQFQSKFLTKPDGRVDAGGVTIKKLNQVHVPAPSADEPNDKYDQYVELISKAKGLTTKVSKDLEAGQRVILGLRVLTNTRIGGGAGKYDDRIVVLWKENGAKKFKEFEANTEPSSRYEDGYGTKAYGGDAGGDKRRDLGRIPEGVYTFAKDRSNTYGDILRPTRNIRANRDTNHDGFFDHKDLVTNESALDAGRTFLFHKGGNNITGSAGCQTMKPSAFTDFWKALGSQSEFEYVLVHMPKLP